MRPRTTSRRSPTRSFHIGSCEGFGPSSVQMHHLLRCACIVFLFAFVPGSQALAQGNPGLQPATPKTFSPQTIAAAALLAGVPSNVAAVQDMGAGPGTGADAYASITPTVSPSGAPTHTITVYVKSVQASQLKKGVSGYSGRLKGFIASKLKQELGHKCLQGNGGVDSSPVNSCSQQSSLVPQNFRARRLRSLRLLMMQRQILHKNKN